MLSVEIHDFRSKENSPDSHSKESKKCRDNARKDQAVCVREENGKPGKNDKSGNKKWFQKAEIISFRTFLHCFTSHFIHTVSPVNAL